MADNEFFVVLDRFEGETAVLIVEQTNEQITLPAACIPESADEGTVLRLTLTIDSARTAAARRAADTRVRRLEHKQRK